MKEEPLSEAEIAAEVAYRREERIGISGYKAGDAVSADVFAMARQEANAWANEHRAREKRPVLGHL